MKTARHSTWMAPMAGLLLLAAAGKAGASPNHLANSHFKSDLSGWTLPPTDGYTRNWTNASGSAALGAAAIYAYGTKVLTSNPIQQCVAVVDGAPYTFTLDFRWEAGYGTPEYA